MIKEKLEHTSRISRLLARRRRLLNPLHLRFRYQVALVMVLRIYLLFPCLGVDGRLVVEAVANASKEGGISENLAHHVCISDQLLRFCQVFRKFASIAEGSGHWTPVVVLHSRRSWRPLCRIRSKGRARGWMGRYQSLCTNCKERLERY